MLKLISFMYVLRQKIVSFSREKNFSASLQKLFLPVSELFSFLTLIELSRQARLALLSKTTSSREIS